MVLAEELRQAVLKAALQGKLTEQLETDSDVDEMLISIQEEKEKLIADKKIKKEKPLPEIQNEEISFEIPDNWRWEKVGKLVEIKNGFTPKRTDEALWNPKEIPWFTVEDIHDQGLAIYHTAQFISRKALGKTRGRIIPPHTVLLCCTSATIGRYAMAEIELTTNQQWNGLVIKEEYKHIICSDYILIWVSSLKEKMTEIAKSTTFPFLSVDKLANFTIPIPPIEEQHRIVDKINEIMPKIDEYEKIEKELEVLEKEFPTNMKDALLQAAMQGKLTEQLESDSSVDEILASIQKEKKQLIKEKKIYKDKKLVESVENKFDIDIPNNWRFVNLQEICTKITDGEHKTPNRVSEYQGYYLLSARNILNGKLVLDDVDYVSKEEYDIISKRCNPRRNDILISCSGSVGRCCLISDDNNYVMVRSAAMIHCLQMNNKYIMYAIQSPYMQAQIDGLKKQSVQANLFQSAIASLLIPIPPIEEQHRIVERLNALLPLCEELREV